MSKTLDKLSEFLSSPEVRSAITEDAQNTGVGAASILDGLASTVGSFGNFVGGMEGTTRLQDAITGTKREKTEDRIEKALALLDRTENAIEVAAPKAAPKAAAPKAAAPKAAAPKAAPKAEPKAAEPKAADPYSQESIDQGSLTEPAAKSKLTVDPYTPAQKVLLKNVAETTAANQESEFDRQMALLDNAERESRKVAALEKAGADLDLEEAALKKEHLAMREADRQASNEGMAGALKAEASRQASVSADKASSEGMAGQLKAEAARQASNEGMAGQLKSEAARQASVPEEPEVDYTDKAISLFKNTHGSDFDPNSVKDKGKLEDMKKLLAQNKGKEMSPNQFALQFYREYP